MNFRLRVQLLDMLVPTMILMVVLVLLHQSSFDAIIAGHFFDKDKYWVYRDNYYLEKIFHKGGAKFIAFVILAMSGYLLHSLIRKKNGAFQEYIKFVTLSSILTIFLVFLLKKISSFPCPWDSASFGGKRDFVPILSVLSEKYPRGNCFPAGHASGGYAFLSMFYGYSFVYAKRCMKCLFPGLLLGGFFGVVQQVRGAHFLSHDVGAIIVSIFSSWVTYMILRKYNQLYEKEI